jgi:hypothetical protein
VAPLTTASFADMIAALRSPKRISRLEVDEFLIQKVPGQEKKNITG